MKYYIFFLYSLRLSTGEIWKKCLKTLRQTRDESRQNWGRNTQDESQNRERQQASPYCFLLFFFFVLFILCEIQWIWHKNLVFMYIYVCIYRRFSFCANIVGGSPICFYSLRKKDFEKGEGGRKDWKSCVYHTWWKVEKFEPR